jgi:tetratricopeptide (TPR) repeat protein
VKALGSTILGALGLAAALGLLPAHANAQAMLFADADEEVFYADERMIQANALLGDRTQYPRAIALYRQVLDEFPSNLMARLWLARVHSWQGDHDLALAEYDRLLAMDPPFENLDLERAEVLSWAGRYEEAIAAFDRILAERPDEQRAAVGKARAYSWSGRRGKAAKSYELALGLGEDSTIRQELGELKSGLGAGGDAQGQHYFDSDGFSRTSVRSAAAVDLTFDTRFIGSMAFSRVGRDDALRASLGVPTASDGLSGLVGVERSLTDAVVVSAQAGYAWWASAPGQWLARGRIETTLPTDTSLTLQVDHGSFLDWSDSYETVLVGLDGTNLRTSVWQGITEQWSAFGYAESTFVSDGNTRLAIGGSTDYKPFREVELLLGLGFDYLTYTGRSVLYYDPTVDVGTALLGRIEQPLTDWLRVFAEANVGVGYAEEIGLEGFGVTYGFSGGLGLKRGGVELAVHGGRSQSQRATVYTSYAFGAALNVAF